MKMVAYIVLALVLLIVLGFAVVQSMGPKEKDIVDRTGESSVEIVLTDEGYQPRFVRISQGTEVTFSTTRAHQHWPASNLHPSHDIYSEFDPEKPLESDESWSFRFDKVGEWGMHDHIRSYFVGTIYVVE